MLLSILARGLKILARELATNATGEFGKAVAGRIGDAWGILLARRIDPTYARDEKDEKAKPEPKPEAKPEGSGGKGEA